jgi:hypothetical protein
MAQGNFQQAAGMLEQYRIGKNLRALARPFGSVAKLAALGIGEVLAAKQFVTDHARDVYEAAGMSFRPGNLLYSIHNAPAPAELGGPRAKLAHLGYRNSPVSLLNEHALNAAQSKLDGQGQANGTTAADKHRHFGFFCHDTARGFDVRKEFPKTSLAALLAKDSEVF